MDDDLRALRVFETPRPPSGAKFAALKTLLGRGVPEAGLHALIANAPWDDENKAKWHCQLIKIASKTVVCPFCIESPEPNCPVAKYMATHEAHLTPMEVDLLG